MAEWQTRSFEVTVLRSVGSTPTIDTKFFLGSDAEVNEARACKALLIRFESGLILQFGELAER